MNISRGTRVKIKGDLSITSDEFGIDQDGEMDSMRGKIFKIEDASYSWVTIIGPSGNLYTFNMNDIELAKKAKPLKPQIFEFDEKLLDI